MQARGTSVADALRPEEERLIEARGLLEALTVPPVLGTTLGSLRSALDALVGPLPQQHVPGAEVNTDQVALCSVA